MPNVIAIFSGRRRELSGCEIYRTTMPFHYLQEEKPKWKTTWAFIEDILELSKEHGRNVLREIILNYDMFVFPRLYFTDNQGKEGFLGLINGLHELGKKCVYELDDDLTNDYRHVFEGDAMTPASLCDAITVSTPYLKTLMEEKTGKHAYVLPNMISPDVWFAKNKTEFAHRDKIVIGLTGSPSHEEDWKILRNVLPRIVRDPRVHLILCGYQPEYLQDLPNTTYLPGLLYEYYAQVIQTCDIILAPVNDDPFNLGKSPIKCIEGMAARRHIQSIPAGAACIASKHPIYESLITSGKNGLLVDHTEEGWEQGLRYLIENQGQRQDLQISGHDLILRKYVIDKKINLWDNAYQAILDKH